jgi:hypothetical protein
MTSTPTMPSQTGSARDGLVPVLLAAVFTAVVTGWFNLAETFSTPAALLAGATWGVLLGLAATWLRSKPAVGAWLEDVFVALGAVGFAFAGCGGLMALLMLDGALDSPSLTGETLQNTFFPSIPYYIAVNGILEMFLIPAVIVLAWRPGLRRALIIATSTLYFAMRVWTYLSFAPARMGWAESVHAGTPLDAAARRQAAADLMLDDPRWMLLLLMFAAFLFAAQLSRVRERISPSDTGAAV